MVATGSGPRLLGPGGGTLSLFTIPANISTTGYSGWVSSSYMYREGSGWPLWDLQSPHLRLGGCISLGISLTAAKINIVKYSCCEMDRYRCVTLTSCYICQAPGELINTTPVRIKMCPPPPPTGDTPRGEYFPNFRKGEGGKIRIFTHFLINFSSPTLTLLLLVVG